MRRIAQLREDAGTALVEYALVLPMLLLLVFGMLDFGRAFNYWIDTTHLANEAARFAAVDNDPSDSGDFHAWIRDQANTEELRNGGSASIDNPLEICITYPNATFEVGDPVKVVVKTEYKWLRVLKLPVSTTIAGSSVMRLEAPPEDVEDGCT